MSWNAVIGIACILSFFLPVAVILYNRYYTHRSLMALLVYFVMTALYNLMALELLPSSPAFLNKLGLIDNYMDVPLMLIALLFFCPNRQKQRLVHVLICSFIGYEIVVSLIYGFSAKALVYIMGPGLALILGYTAFLFARQAKFSIMHRKNQGRTIMLAAILFAYACYGLIYYFYYVQRTPYKQDTLLLYYISSMVASVSMAIGLHLMRKRMKELKALRTTRKELEVFFSRN